MEPVPCISIDPIPPGRWGVGVSGGADSVALLWELRQRPELTLHVVHLNHQTRGAETDADAQFVRDLSRRWGIEGTFATRAEVQPLLQTRPGNRSAFYRALRIVLFRRVVAERDLAGMILAHHADDLAETVWQRLLRGSGYAGLAGMRPSTRLGGMLVLRPMLGARSQQIRRMLRSAGLAWREDSSNSSSQYLRNRLRALLRDRPGLAEAFLEVGRSAESLRKWVASAAPVLGESFPIQALASQPRILAEEAARRWLCDRGCDPAKLLPGVIDRLVSMADDAATPSPQDFPDGVRVKRKQGRIG